MMSRDQIMNFSRELSKAHYVLIALLVTVSVAGGTYCGSMSFMFLGLICTLIQLTCFSAKSPLRDKLINGRWRGLTILFAAALSFVGFLYMIDEIANNNAGSPRYPIAAAGCGLFALGMAIWLVVATCGRIPQQDAEPSPSKRFFNSSFVAAIILCCTLSGLSCALRAAAVFQPTQLVVHGCFPWEDEIHSYSGLQSAHTISFIQRTRSNNTVVQEYGTRLSFNDGGSFDLGPSWRWRCPRDKNIVDSRIMALLRPYVSRVDDTEKTARNPIAAQLTQEPKDYGIANDESVDAQIETLEAYLRSHPTPFDTYGHNVLRHLYMSVDQRKAMEQCDLIFSHSFMDEYTLQCLSDWRLDREPDLAVQNLLKVSRHYPELKFLHAACTLEIARLYKGQNKLPNAMHFLAMLQNDRDHDLSAYRAAAEEISN